MRRGLVVGPPLAPKIGEAGPLARPPHNHVGKVDRAVAITRTAHDRRSQQGNRRCSRVGATYVWKSADPSDVDLASVQPLLALLPRVVVDEQHWMAQPLAHRMRELSAERIGVGGLKRSHEKRFHRVERAGRTYGAQGFRQKRSGEANPCLASPEPPPYRAPTPSTTVPTLSNFARSRTE